jgi:hypothetical protein
VNETTLIPVRFVRPHMSHLPVLCSYLFSHKAHLRTASHAPTRQTRHGHESFPGQYNLWRGADAAVLVCDLTNEKSIQNLLLWLGVPLPLAPWPCVRALPPSLWCRARPWLYCLRIWSPCVQEAERYFTKPRIFVVGNKSDEHSDMHIQSSAEIVVHCPPLSLLHTHTHTTPHTPHTTHTCAMNDS